MFSKARENSTLLVYLKGQKYTNLIAFETNRNT